MIIVAHRLSTIKNVDRIFVMKGGKIIEVGTNEELIDHKRLLRRTRYKPT